MRDHVGCMDREGRLDLMLELLCMHIGKYYSLYYEYVPRPDVGKPPKHRYRTCAKTPSVQITMEVKKQAPRNTKVGKGGYSMSDRFHEQLHNELWYI